MAHKPDYRLPNGKRTTSADRYVREWRKLTKPFAKYFSLERIACDPGARFVSKRGGPSFDIPLHMLHSFNDHILPYLPKS